MSSGEFLTRSTIWISIVAYTIGCVVFARDADRWARLAWTTGCASLLAHVICAFKFLSRVESCIRLRRNRSPNRGGVCDQLGRWSFHKLRSRDLVDGRRSVVVVCGIKLVSSPAVVSDTVVAQLPDLHHLQRDSCFQRWVSTLDRTASLFDSGSELDFDSSPTYRTERGSAGSNQLKNASMGS